MKICVVVCVCTPANTEELRHIMKKKSEALGENLKTE